MSLEIADADKSLVDISDFVLLEVSSSLLDLPTTSGEGKFSVFETLTGAMVGFSPVASTGASEAP